ncbi:MAG: hypothetical protein KF705_03800 [Phycisphaeraceae bacterium]|nr:hypothetical protein [Phycisphaeraceae bacterium]
MQSRTLQLKAMVIVCACAGLPMGCATMQQRSTRLTTEDVKEMAVQLAASMAASDFLRDRNPQSLRMVVAFDRVENLSSDVVPLSEQWYLMERVRASTPLASLGAQRNIGFVIPVEHLNQLRDRVGAEAALAGAGRTPTHAMRGVLRSVTRAAGVHRTDLYSFETRVIDLETGRIEWSDSFELKRAAVGLAYD